MDQGVLVGPFKPSLSLFTQALSRFKLHLRPKKRLIDNETIPPLPPNKTIVEIFADYMKYLFVCAKSYISETHTIGAWESLEEDALFILTHPNGWGGPQQAQMRDAAILAGLIPDTPKGRERVSFVTEGEASLHFCLLNGLTIAGNRVCRHCTPYLVN